MIDDGIKTASNSFVAAISSGSDESLKDGLQSLLFAIFNQKRLGMADKYSSVAYSFIVLYSFCKEGHLNRCNIFSQYFSRIIWFGRVAIYNTIVKEAEKQDLGFFEYALRLMVGLS